MLLGIIFSFGKTIPRVSTGSAQKAIYTAKISGIAILEKVFSNDFLKWDA